MPGQGRRPGPCGMRMRPAIRQPALPGFMFLSLPALPCLACLAWGCQLSASGSARGCGSGVDVCMGGWMERCGTGLLPSHVTKPLVGDCGRSQPENHLTPLRCTVEALLLARRPRRANDSTTPHHSSKPSFHGSCLTPQPLFCLSPCFASIARVVFLIYF